MLTSERRAELAERYGFQHYRCPRHGGFWSDTGPYCEDCPEPESVPCCPSCGGTEYVDIAVESVEPHGERHLDVGVKCLKCGAISPEEEWR